MEMAQILAVVIFAVMFLLIVTEKIERHWVSLGCGLLMLVVVFGFCMHSPAAVWNTLGLQSFHLKNMEKFLDVSLEEVTANKRPKISSTKSTDVLEEYFSQHELIRVSNEQRLILR